MKNLNLKIKGLTSKWEKILTHDEQLENNRGSLSPINTNTEPHNVIMLIQTKPLLKVVIISTFLNPQVGQIAGYEKHTKLSSSLTLYHHRRNNV